MVFHIYLCYLLLFNYFNINSFSMIPFYSYSSKTSILNISLHFLKMIVSPKAISVTMLISSEKFNNAWPQLKFDGLKISALKQVRKLCTAMNHVYQSIYNSMNLFLVCFFMWGSWKDKPKQAHTFFLGKQASPTLHCPLSLKL